MMEAVLPSLLTNPRAERLTVQPPLSSNLYLDHLLKMKRGPDGVELEPEMAMGSGNGFCHFSIVTTVGEEAAWWAVGDEHAIPASVEVKLLRPASVHRGTILGRGTVLRLGKSLMMSEGVVTQGTILLAKVTVTFVHYELAPAPRT